MHNRLWNEAAWLGACLLVFVCGGVAAAYATEPAPVSMEAIADKTTLQQGESIQLRVVIGFADESIKDVTAARHGTHYETAGTLMGQPVIRVSPDGLVTALSGEGRAMTTETLLVVNKPYQLHDFITFTVVANNALKIQVGKTLLHVGETVQLRVIQVLQDGTTRDVTNVNAGTVYLSTAESMLIPEPDGRVTCIGTAGKPKERATIVAVNGDFHDTATFTLLPGPGSELDVTVDDPVLREGEQTRLYVYTSLPGNGNGEIILPQTGMHFLVFPRDHFLSIDQAGFVKAVDSIEPYDKMNVIVFVRHADAVGWTKIEIRPANER